MSWKFTRLSSRLLGAFVLAGIAFSGANAQEAKSVKEVRHRSDSHQLDAFSDFPDRPLIPKESGRGPGNKRVPKITFKAKSFEYDDATEVHTVQVGVEEGVDFIKLF